LFCGFWILVLLLAMVSMAVAAFMLGAEGADSIETIISKWSSMFDFATVVQGLCVAVFVGIIIMKLKAPKLNLPPGPIALPIVGNWLQVS
jgi:hypothetical protein